MLISVESVGVGHPDKVCDRISDAILDECLKQDKYSRVACETLIKSDHVIVAGEITTNAKIDVEKIVNDVIQEVGYYDIKPKVENYLELQSKDIAQGVDIGGAGDQGFMIGYACNDTKYYMPLAYEVVNMLLKKANTDRLSGKFKYSRSDMKAQITMDTDTKRVDTVLMSIQHLEDFNEKEFKEYIKNEIIFKVLKEYNLNTDCKILINPTGRFVIGGSIGDAGLTGRKIIVDNYSFFAPHGGGAFSGKDPTKVDRSGAYIARYIAKNIVAAGLCNNCTVQIAYAIGVKEPVSLNIQTDNKDLDLDKLSNKIRELVDLTPNGIIEKLNLRNPIYKNLTTYGHFGENPKDMEWEKLDLVDKLKKI